MESPESIESVCMLCKNPFTSFLKGHKENMPIYEKVCASCRGKAIRTRIEKQNTDKTESDISKRIAEGVHLLESAGDSETDPYQSEELNGEEGSWYSPTYSQAICSECGKPFTSRRVVSRRYRGVYKKVCDTCRDKRIVE